MPVIKDFVDVQPLDVIPSSQRATASDFATISPDVGAGIQDAANKLYDAEQTSETADVHARLAKLRSDQTVGLMNRLATMKPGDSEFSANFANDFDNSASQIGDGIQTAGAARAWTTGVADLKADLLSRAGAYQVQAAGVQAKQNYLSMLDNNRNTLFQDPTQFDSILSATEKALNDPNGTYARMPPDDRAALARQTQEELALSAIQGTARANPDQAQADWDSGKYAPYISGASDWRATSEIESAQRAREVENARIQIANDKAEKAQQKQTEDQFVIKLAKDPSSLSANDIINSNLPPVGEGSKEQFLNFIGKGLQQPDKDAKTYGPGFLPLFDRVHAADGDPNKITDQDQLNQYADNGQLTFAGLNALRMEVSGKKTLDGDIEGELKKGLYQTAKTALTGTNELYHLRDPNGDVQLQKFMSYFLPAYQQEREAGKTPVQLLNPDSPDYLGKAIDQFKRTPQQQMRDMIDANPGMVGGDMPAAPPLPAAPKTYKAAPDVISDYRAGVLTRDQAAKILRDNGWAQ